MKKSAEILGLPIISITEGRELGTSKTLLIDARKGIVAAITVEDEEWYRGVKLIPYEAIIAIGDDAITIVHSENILTLAEAGDYESMLDENIRVLGTKAITKNGTIQGKITELLIGDDGKIEKCEVTANDGSVSEISADQISIFGKQVTMIDPDSKKNKLLRNAPAAAEKKKPAAVSTKAASVPANAIVEKIPPVEDKIPEPEVEITAAELPAVPVEPEPPEPDVKPIEDVIAEASPVENVVAQDEPEPDKPKVQQAEALRAALKRAMENQKKSSGGQQQTPNQPATPKKSASKKTDVDERRRMMLLGKKAARTIKADTGAVIVEAGAEITEEVLQKAKLANKFIDLSMNCIS